MGSSNRAGTFVLLAGAIASCEAFDSAPSETGRIAAADAGRDGSPVSPTGQDGGVMTDRDGSPPLTQPDGAAVTSICASATATTRICDDFDTGALGAKWTRQEKGTGSEALFLDSTGATGSPGSLRFQAPPGLDEPSAQLIDETAVNPGGVQITFDVQILQRPTQALIFVVHTWLLSASAFYNYAVGIAGSTLTVSESVSGSQTFHNGAPYPADNEWHRIGIAGTFVGPERHLIVSVDGARGIDVRLQSIELSSAYNSKTDFGGYIGGKSDKPLDVRVDNFLFDLTPR